ncbi:MAG: YfhO family protein, partial [Acidimicrobiales bacterium]|nr:YfhO family protein [Acidimicrobiales bacterium]
CPPEPVEVERPEPGVVRATVTNDGLDAVLSIASQPLPGWSATIDGQPVDVYPVDAMRLGVTMPGGTHDVEFRYRQPGLVASGLVALLALILVALFVIEPGRLRPPPPSA